MPGMSGLQLLENLPQNEGANRLPYTFIITAFRKYEYALNGFRLGILDYIEKPLHEEKIGDAINLYLSKLQAETIDLKVQDGFCRIQIDRIAALKAVGRGKVTIYASDELLPEAAHSLNQLHALLPSNFQYIRRDCVINVREVKHYNLKTREISVVCQNRYYTFTCSRENMKRLIHCYNVEKDEP